MRPITKVLLVGIVFVAVLLVLGLKYAARDAAYVAGGVSLAYVA
jgi:hypothetical protein